MTPTTLVTGALSAKTQADNVSDTERWPVEIPAPLPDLYPLKSEEVTRAYYTSSLERMYAGKVRDIRAELAKGDGNECDLLLRELHLMLRGAIDQSDADLRRATAKAEVAS